MRMTDVHSGLEVLERNDCLALLRASELGRLAIATHGSPDIFPVNFELVDDTMILLRTGPGTKLRADGGRACFEIDGSDRAARSGWSVVAKGTLRELTPTDGWRWRRAQEADDGIDPWAGRAGRDHVLCLMIEVLTGRRVGTAST